MNRNRFRTWVVRIVTILAMVGLAFTPMVEVVSADGPATETVIVVRPVEGDVDLPPDGGCTVEGFAWGD